MDQDNANKIENQNSQTPWYKIRMMWLVIALPLIAVIASITTMVIAVKHAPIVVEHNESYKTSGEKHK